MLQVTIISIATMNLGKYYKPPYNIGVVGKVRLTTALAACLPAMVHMRLAGSSWAGGRLLLLKALSMKHLKRCCPGSAEMPGCCCSVSSRCIAQVPKGLPGYVGGTFFPLVGSTGGTLGLAVLVRWPVLCADDLVWRACRAARHICPWLSRWARQYHSLMIHHGHISCGLRVQRTWCCAPQVCIIDMAESISIARALALKNRYTLAPTQVQRNTSDQHP